MRRLVALTREGVLQVLQSLGSNEGALVQAKVSERQGCTRHVCEWSRALAWLLSLKLRCAGRATARARAAAGRAMRDEIKVLYIAEE